VPVTKTETIIVASLFGAVAFVVIGIVDVTMSENKAKNDAAVAAGFADSAEMEAAKKNGISDPTKWRAKVSADQQALEQAEKDRRTKAAKADAELAERNRPATDRMTLSAQTWEKGGFGSIGLMSMTISNMNPFGVKDITIHCTFDGKSGTQLSARLQTIYDTIPANGSKKFAKINIGFIDSQSARAGCSLVSALRS
jgi:hypothetical protein